MITVCGKRDELCSNAAKEDMELVYGNGSSCNCLPSCFEMNFGKSGTFSKIVTLNGKHGLENISQEYFTKNMAVLHFFFGDTRFRKQIKSEIYGFTEALSNIGGLLGLCLGFSILSLVELIYFATLRLFCNYVSKRNNNSKNNDGKYHGHVIPFMK